MPLLERLPAPADIGGLARYWKRTYNTPAGKGTVDKFIECYQRMVANK